MKRKITWIAPSLLLAASVCGCRIAIQKPAQNDTVVLPSTKVIITGNASYSGLRVAVDNVDVSNQMVSTGTDRYEGDLNLTAGTHTITASADIYCWYCTSRKTRSTDTKTFFVSIPQVCGRVAGPPLITLNASVISASRLPGQRRIPYQMSNGQDQLLIIVDDAPGLQPHEMRLELDLDSPRVTNTKAIEAWSFCQRSLAGRVEASLMGGIDPGVACNPLTEANNYRSGCTSTQSILLNMNTTRELWLRKHNIVGIWYDAEGIDSSIWQAFGGRSVRFIWRTD